MAAPKEINLNASSVLFFLFICFYLNLNCMPLAVYANVWLDHHYWFNKGIFISDQANA